MPKGTKVAKAEQALMKSAHKKHMSGERADRYVYGALNNMGLKKGNKTTRKGAARAKKK